MKTVERILTLSLTVGLGLAPPGCREDEPGFKTVTLSGTVEDIDRADSSVRISYYSEKHDRNLTATVVVTPETEIFINGIVAGLEDVNVGERAEGEAVVTHEGDRRVIRVTRVRIERAVPVVSGQPAAAASPSAEPATSPAGKNDT